MYVDNPMNQSKREANTRSWREARENRSIQKREQ